MALDAKYTKPANKHIDKGSIPARIVKMPKMTETRDWRKLNPTLKGFKDAKVSRWSD